MPRDIMDTAEAADYLGLSVRHMKDRRDIPRHNVGTPGSPRPAWRYVKTELDQWLVTRRAS